MESKLPELINEPNSSIVRLSNILDIEDKDECWKTLHSEFGKFLWNQYLVQDLVDSFFQLSISCGVFDDNEDYATKEYEEKIKLDYLPLHIRVPYVLMYNDHINIDQYNAVLNSIENQEGILKILDDYDLYFVDPNNIIFSRLVSSLNPSNIKDKIGGSNPLVIRLVEYCVENKLNDILWYVLNNQQILIGKDVYYLMFLKSEKFEDFLVYYVGYLSLYGITGTELYDKLVDDTFNIKDYDPDKNPNFRILIRYIAKHSGSNITDIFKHYYIKYSETKEERKMSAVYNAQLEKLNDVLKYWFSESRLLSSTELDSITGNNY